MLRKRVLFRSGLVTLALLTWLGGELPAQLSSDQVAERGTYIAWSGPASSGSFSPRVAETHDLHGSSQPRDLGSSSKPRALTGSAQYKTLDGSAKPEAKQAARTEYMGSYLQPPQPGDVFSAANFRRLGCNAYQTTVDQVAYTRCGNDWFRRFYSRGEVHYRTVRPPVGR